MSATVRGRPGPPSKSARRRAERTISDRLPELAARAVELALMGDPACLVACLDRAWPAQAAQHDKRESAQ